jgi:hypothetical protein
MIQVNPYYPILGLNDIQDHCGMSAMFASGIITPYPLFISISKSTEYGIAVTHEGEQ